MTSLIRNQHNNMQVHHKLFTNYVSTFRAVVPKLFLIAYHLWALYFHRVPLWKHLVPGKLILPNIIRSKVWQTRLHANVAWTTWLWEII